MPVSLSAIGRCTAVVIAALLLAGNSGCQTTESSVSAVTGASGAAPESEQVSYNLFFSPSDHVDELLAAGKIDQASRVWAAQSEHFRRSGRASARNSTVALAQALAQKYEPLIRQRQAAIDGAGWPAPSERWPAIKTALETTDTLVGEIDRHEVLREPGLALNAADRLKSSAAALRTRVSGDAAARFADYALADSDSFIDVYPVPPPATEFMVAQRGVWQAALAGASSQAIGRFAERYRKVLGDSELALAGGLYYRAVLAESAGATAGLSSVMAAVAKTRESGLPLAEMPDARVRIVEVTSRSLLSEGQIEFPIGIGIDLPFTAEKAEFDKAFDTSISPDTDVLILIDVAMARNDRKIETYDKVASEFQSGTREDPNPEHPVAQAQVTQAQLNLANVRQSANINSLTCYGWGCLATAILNGAAIGAAEGKLKEAMNRLSTTPLTLTKPVYQAYQFNRASIKAAKVGTINYYVIDRVAKSFVRGTFDVRESRDFVIAYGLHNRDRDRAKHLSSADTEEKVAAFEHETITVPLSRILEQHAEPGANPQPLPTLVAIRETILADKNRNLAAVKARTYTTSTAGDRRFESVVKVLQPNGLGSGFFVTDDLVITNYHVIRESKFVELKLFGGSETFGKVIAQDVRLDLALVKVQERGIPVSLYSERVLPLGQTVEAIGHPKGYEFTITRGVISALREIPSAYAPDGRKVRMIQTDTAISPGNSGGPLFLGDRVIGVNTQKNTAKGVEGLSFAVHYGEVKEFLERNGVSHRMIGQGS